MNNRYYFPYEPTVRVALAINQPFGLTLHGEYNVDGSEDLVSYLPKNKDSYISVKGTDIGRGFHWQQDRTLDYAGVIQLIRNEEDSTLLNIVPAETYLKSVVSSEMSPLAPLEYLKAHAIISRSWLLSQIRRRPSELSCKREVESHRITDFTQSAVHRGFDVCNDDHCQRYHGLADINNEAVKAVEQTRGLVLTDSEGEIADCRFSKCCGGHTEVFSHAWEDLDYPYLTSHADPYCNPASLSSKEKDSLSLCLKEFDASTPYWEWETEVKSAIIADNLKNKYDIFIGNIKNISPLKRGASGRIALLKIDGEDGFVEIGKELAIRSVLSASHLYSSNFTVSKTAEGFRLHGRGWGHGVGLCQIGAAVMAIRGMSAREILEFYYPSTKLEKAYD